MKMRLFAASQSVQVFALQEAQTSYFECGKWISLNIFWRPITMELSLR